MQKLRCFQFPGIVYMGPCIIMLQHEVMFVDEWQNNGPQDLVTGSLCNQNAPVFVVHNILLPTPLLSARQHQMWTFADSSWWTAVRSRPRWGTWTSMQMSFPETLSDSLCRNYLVIETDCFSSCPGGWFQTILEVKMLFAYIEKRLRSLSLAHEKWGQCLYFCSVYIQLC